MSQLLHQIKPFCAVRNWGNAYKNKETPTPRMQFILSLLDSLSIPYEIDTFLHVGVPMHNIHLKGRSNKMFLAHHDVLNHTVDNANDNSASVINLIYLKTLCPEVNVVFTDAEEVGLWGASQLASSINAGNFGKIDWVLNLELTGKGGKHFIIGNYPGVLTNLIADQFNTPIIDTPMCDSVPLYHAGIDTTVINPLGLCKEGSRSSILGPNGYLDNSNWMHVHGEMDSIENISIEDMREFVEEVLVPIAKVK